MSGVSDIEQAVDNGHGLIGRRNFNFLAAGSQQAKQRQGQPKAFKRKHGSCQSKV
jgi:hypothetical protein